ncbi:MAG: ABC-F family ATP-binding cassette domain-containing protein [Ignavibacteriaceae bacterium]|nr:MAG: ABC-F family ATP-binding cassette domain-containing protein [Ignavibacteriaceae bacterium]MBV6445794.1 Vitamin B12 import ATP-binding protein BtuD [Ignavibacteriaceae bacterium]MBW7873818.1 ABC-F family ATP-binding cassette domain-containing protein [Ignavibacteria bacterium]MBZ0197808.1 ABC-F family ATP-binding cassette domain-containing protein [Ignavibacteriaceae bacterium]WKZ72639.1 MAG: ABC-F family ATP-binding cassette domain-containing protein [Ignavibacteriaceae bacterium]
MIDIVNLSLQFGGNYLYRDVNFKINAGDKISLVGSNGTGKSSLLKMIAGMIEPEKGDIFKRKGMAIGYLPQENVTHKGRPLIEEALAGVPGLKELQGKENEITTLLNDPNLEEGERSGLIEQLGEIHLRLEETDSYSAEARVEKVLLGLGFSIGDFEKLTDHFSGGWQMRIALAKMLIAENDLLMMDEPTNHLDIDSLQWLTGFLKTYKGALLLVSHDRRFVNDVTNKTLEIFNRKFTVFNGNFDHYLRAKAERDERLEHEFEHQQRKIKDIERFIERFRYKATKAKQVQSRVKMLERFDKIELPDFEKGIAFRFPEPPKSAEIVFEIKDLTKVFGDNLVLDRVNLRIEKGDKIAFVGPNGAGKSTLSKIIASELAPTSGEKITGYNTSVAYFSQEQSEVLDPDLDVFETIAQEAGDMTVPQIRALAGSFLFSGDDVFKKVGVLSGGEKSRVSLALLLLQKANLLVMDEPTNHLDYNSKLVLQKALMNFKGSLVIVSHDVDFLQPIVNKVVEIRKGSFRIFPGTIEYYLRKREEEIAGFAGGGGGGSLPGGGGGFSGGGSGSLSGGGGGFSGRSGGLNNIAGDVSGGCLEGSPGSGSGGGLSGALGIVSPGSVNEGERKETVGSEETLNRKEQKRLEAELRNRRYKATKEINEKIANIETEISDLEERTTELEKQMESPEFFDNPIAAGEKTRHYQALKDETEQKMEKWAELQEELQKILDSIS